MKYYIREFRFLGENRRTAGGKAREDIELILSKQNFHPVDIHMKEDKFHESSFQIFKKISGHQKRRKIWHQQLLILKRGDLLLIQIPIFFHSLFISSELKQLVRRGVKIVLLVHDLELFRVSKRAPFLKRQRLNFEEKSLLNIADKIIVHNHKMKKEISTFGVEFKKAISLEIFDYLIPEYDKRINSMAFEKSKPVILAGNLSAKKAQYLSLLPSAPEFNLYGINYQNQGKKNIHYYGSFLPDQLPFELSGSFGLVWDGHSADTCSGVYGEYLKINNPHKTSLYLASGIPVVIWEEAALADFIRENHCGITVRSLSEINKKIEEMSLNEYQEIKANAENIGKKLREGFYTKKALSQCIL